MSADFPNRCSCGGSLKAYFVTACIEPVPYGVRKVKFPDGKVRKTRPLPGYDTEVKCLGATQVLAVHCSRKKCGKEYWLKGIERLVGVPSNG